MKLQWDTVEGGKTTGRRRVLVAVSHGVWYRVVYLAKSGAFLSVRYGILGSYERIGHRMNTVAEAQRRAQEMEDERNPPFEPRGAR